MVGWSLCNPFFLTPKMSGLTLTLLNVLGVLGVLNMLNVLNMPMDASLACWALLLGITSLSVPSLALRVLLVYASAGVN